MKKNLFTVIFFLIAFLAFCFSMIVFMGGGSNLRKPSYYSNKNNYEEIVGRVVEIDLSDDELYIELALDEYAQSHYSGRFIINPSNKRIVERNGFYHEIREGDTITIMSAPGYFSDGYIVPIVGLRKDSKVYLDFDEGVSNQIEYSHNLRDGFLKMFISSTSILVISFSLFVFLLIPKNKNKKNMFN